MVKWEKALFISLSSMLNFVTHDTSTFASTTFLSIGYSSKIVYEYYRRTCDQFWKDKIFV